MIIGDFTSVTEITRKKCVGFAHFHSCLVACKDCDTENSECLLVAGNKIIITIKKHKHKSSVSFRETAK